MARTAIVTDSAAGLPTHLVAEYSIHVVPLFTPVMDIHSGPGTIGLAFCARE
jgi:fatty acid-binding protein DegV